VLHDVIGLFERFTPKFVKKYADLKGEALKAVRQYREDVEKGVFPGKEHSF
jgi:3-methyl-2-oxobutanoate hydroxymethyltransferase